MNIIIPTPSLTTRVEEHEVITEAREKTTGFPRASHDVGSTDELYSTPVKAKKANCQQEVITEIDGTDEALRGLRKSSYAEN